MSCANVDTLAVKNQIDQHIQKKNRGILVPLLCNYIFASNLNDHVDCRMPIERFILFFGYIYTLIEMLCFAYKLSMMMHPRSPVQGSEVHSRLLIIVWSICMALVISQPISWLRQVLSSCQITTMCGMKTFLVVNQGSRAMSGDYAEPS